MSSFLKDFKSRAEVLYHYDDEDDTTNQRRREKSHETRTLQSTAVPAAMRGLYAPPPRRRIESHPQVEQLDRVHKEEDDDPNDPIIRNSMYPQMNGKRQSELDAEVANSGNYSSDSNPERRPVRVYIYPQAKYIPVAVETPIKKPARYLYGKAKPKKGLIGHGETQWFTEPFHHGRVENSRMQYVLRKAKQAGLNHNSPEFGHTMTKRAYNVPFCEISDLAGAPVMETLLIDFLKAWRKFQDKADVPKGLQLAMLTDVTISVELIAEL
ncbi:hypothetical protein N0V91_005094 [Didymella pomorum]|uniref:Uncharacterized protein n=1 Tax=Didymella pomorum TaxID=749634 RepID=A0A9W9D8K4_9PLEO|nr:hypothetical protein N0V91_005094 [Didymella pomorum]